MAYERQFKHKKQWTHKEGGYKKNFQKKRDDYIKPEGLQVIVRNNDIQKALRKLKRMVKDSGHMEELKNKEYYRKPSEIKREKRKAGRARWLKKQKDLKLQRGY